MEAPGRVSVPVTLAHMESAQADMAAIDEPQITHEIRIGDHVLPGRWYAVSAVASFSDQNERVYAITYAQVIS